MYREGPVRPRRPAIPVALYALIVVVVTIRAVTREGLVGPTSMAIKGAAGLGLLGGFAAIAVRRRNAALAGALAVLCASVAVGLVLGSYALMGGETFLVRMSKTPISACTLKIQSDSTQKGDVYRCRATLNGKGVPSGDVWLATSEPVEMGSLVQGVGRFTPNGEDEWGVASRMQGVWGSVRMAKVAHVRDPEGPLETLLSARKEILRRVKPQTTPERALLAGCVCGWRPGLREYALDETFSRCGLAHLIAVSGGHIAVLSTLLGCVLGKFRIHARKRAAILATACGLFVLLCGMPLSAIRSWIMTCSALAAGLVGRRSHALTGVSLAGVGIALVDPFATGHVGYLLSVASVAGLCVFSPYIIYVLDSLLPRVPWDRVFPRKIGSQAIRTHGALTEALALSITAQLVTMPLVAQSFGETSPVGPVASMLASCPFTAFVGVGMVAVGCGLIPPLQDALFAVADCLARIILAICTACASMPISTVVIPWGGETYLVWGALALLLLIWPTVSGRWLRRVGMVLASLLVACGLRWRFFAPARICVLDVGQGDSILVQDGGSTVLVDAGPEGSLLEALERNHVTHLDALVITHLHADHYEGAKELVGRIACDHVLVARGVASHVNGGQYSYLMDLAGGDVEELGYGDVLRASGFEMRVIWPTEVVDGDENADSLELLATFDDGHRSLRALLTGDAERNETGSVLASGDVGDIDMLKVGHHGSAESVTTEQAQALDPEISVASAGEGNSYGHPTEACVEALEGSGSLFLCTKDVGDVEVAPGAEGPIVTTQRKP